MAKNATAVILLAIVSLISIDAMRNYVFDEAALALAAKCKRKCGVLPFDALQWDEDAQKQAKTENCVKNVCKGCDGSQHGGTSPDCRDPPEPSPDPLPEPEPPTTTQPEDPKLPEPEPPQTTPEPTEPVDPPTPTAVCADGGEFKVESMQVKGKEREVCRDTKSGQFAKKECCIAEASKIIEEKEKATDVCSDVPDEHCTDEARSFLDNRNKYKDVPEGFLCIQRYYCVENDDEFGPVPSAISCRRQQRSFKKMCTAVKYRYVRMSDQKEEEEDTDPKNDFKCGSVRSATDACFPATYNIGFKKWLPCEVQCTSGLYCSCPGKGSCRSVHNKNPGLRWHNFMHYSVKVDKKTGEWQMLEKTCTEEVSKGGSAVKCVYKWVDPARSKHEIKGKSYMDLSNVYAYGAGETAGADPCEAEVAGKIEENRGVKG